MNPEIEGYEFETDPDVEQEIVDEVRRRLEASMQIANAVVSLAPRSTTGTGEYTEDQLQRISDSFKAGWTGISGQQVSIHGITVLGGPSDALS